VAQTFPRLVRQFLSSKGLLGSVFSSDRYAEANAARITNLLNHFPANWFQGKSVLEVGCGEGDLGQYLVRLGSHVVSCDSRASNIRRLKRKYPDRETFIINLDRDSLPAGYDATLCFGVLYHLLNPEWFLSQLSTPMIFLESVVTDSQESVCPLVDEDTSKIDAASSGRGSRPSPVWIIAHLPHYKLEEISTATANWSTSVFDWTPRNDGHWKRGEKDIRKMWIGRL
jgi:hypothetical protein